MNISKNFSACKEASGNSREASTFLKQEAGNLIPHSWYSKITTNGGKADTIAICLLAELWSLYRSTGQEEHQKDYCFFSKKFHLTACCKIKKSSVIFSNSTKLDKNFNEASKNF